MKKKRFTYDQLRWMAQFRYYEKNKPAFVALLDFQYSWWKLVDNICKALKNN